MTRLLRRMVLSGATTFSVLQGCARSHERDRVDFERMRLQQRYDVYAEGAFPNGAVVLLLFAVIVFLVGLVSEQIAALRFQGSGIGDRGSVIGDRGSGSGDRGPGR